jgi:PEP-CTERM motif
MRFSLLAVGLLAFTAVTANASTSYAFSTSATYSGGTGTVDNTLSLNGCTLVNLCVDWSAGTDGADNLVLQLVFTPFSDPTGNATQFDNFGDIELFCVDSSKNTADANCITTTAFDGHLSVTVNQTVPDAESGVFIDALSGTEGTGGTVSFGTSSFDLVSGQLTYSLQQPANYIIAGVGSSVTSLQGQVTDNTTPEPASLALMGGGLAMFALLRRRRA